MLKNILYFLWNYGNWRFNSNCYKYNRMKLRYRRYYLKSIHFIRRNFGNNYAKFFPILDCYNNCITTIGYTNSNYKRCKCPQFLILVPIIISSINHLIYSNSLTINICSHSSTVMEMGQNTTKRDFIPKITNLWKLLRI